MPEQPLENYCDDGGKVTPHPAGEKLYEEI